MPAPNTTSRLVGTVDLPQQANGDQEQITVSLEQFGNEAPDCLVIDGHACLLYFDPGTATGRRQIQTLRNLLDQALADVAHRNEEIYGSLRVGDHCGLIRVPGEGEPRCPIAISVGDGVLAQCDRVEHVDRHHVVVDGNYLVVAVRH